jgi:hypothetical protein
VAEQDGQPLIETDTLSLTWVKSSASADGSNDKCVEVASTPEHVHVRDSKHPDTTLSFTPETWRTFLRSPLR